MQQAPISHWPMVGLPYPVDLGLPPHLSYDTIAYRLGKDIWQTWLSGVNQ